MRRRFQLSVRVLMLLTLVAGLWLGWKTGQARAQRKAIVAIQALGGACTYDYEVDAKGYGIANAQPRGPQWLHRRLGPEYFMQIYGVGFPILKAKGIHDLAFLEGLTEVRALDLKYTAVTDEEMARIEPLRHLRTLALMNTPVANAGLARLRNLTEVEVLYIGSTRVTHAGLIHLRRMEMLKVLDLSGLKITDAGVANLAGLGRLQRLSLSGGGITDDCLVHLRGLTRLQELFLTSTRVSDAGVADLRRKLPKLKVFRLSP